MKLTNEFEPIRRWAEQRGIYDKGDIKTQFIKLNEEVGELAEAILKKDDEEISDAIGDIIVVLTNLAHLNNMVVEECVNKSYKVITDRTGTMFNGTFVKDK